MSEIKKIIANNLTELRKIHNLTQAELALKLDYSDKSISKWERAEALPDIENLVKICELYNVSLDYLTTEQAKHTKNTEVFHLKRNKVIITCLSVFTIWSIITAFFIITYVILDKCYWQLFLYAIPLSLIICIIFNSIWGKKEYKFWLMALLMWCTLVTIYISLIEFNIWYIFFLGLPLQAIVILWSQLKTK